MRSFVVGLALSLTSAPLFAQSPTAGSPQPAAPRTLVSAADVAALIAKAQSERTNNQPLIAQSMMQFAPYNVSLEYRPGVGVAAVHQIDAELFYVVEGAATLVTGGTLVDGTHTNAENMTGSRVDGGVSRKVSKGDFVIVPEGVPHWFSAIDSTLVVMSLHLPRPAVPARP